MTRPLGARIKARDFVTEWIGRESANRLPGIRQLADMAGVSYVTMWKAVASLREEGVLPERSSDSGGAPRPATTNAWERIRERLGQDIVEGVHLPGAPLPSLKELAAHYGVCRRTLRRALHDLIDRRILLPHGRGYQVPMLSAPHYSNIVLIARGEPTGGELQLFPSRTADHLRWLESECSRAGVNLVVQPFRYRDHDLEFPGDRLGIGGGRLEPGSVLGFHLWTTTLGQDNLSQLVLHLARFRKPIAVLDEGGGMALPVLPPRGPALQAFFMAHGPSSGRNIGRYLLALGHRRVAYLSLADNTLWSKHRLAGLRDAFGAAGATGGVVPFTRGVFGVLPEPDSGVARAARSLDSVLRTEGRGGRRDKVHAGMVRDLRGQIEPVVRGAAIREYGEPLFEAALARKDITVWVAARDALAVAALDFLRGKGVSVPGDISVVGFDDSLDASMHKLTSYSFNGHAVIRAMLSHVLGAESVRQSVRGVGPIEIEGFPVERESTCRTKRKPELLTT